jgi:hypothetical protein
MFCDNQLVVLLRGKVSGRWLQKKKWYTPASNDVMSN